MTTNFYEVDFLSVESDKSGDAITVRYTLGEKTFIHVVDAGYKLTGASVAAHIRERYDNPAFIDHVVATHTDKDHAGGLQTVLQEFGVGTLWMHRPWLYASQLIDHFPTRNSVLRLAADLKNIYWSFAELEEIAIERGIPIKEPFQGAKIGAFTVLSPSPERYFELLIDSDKTPAKSEAQYESVWETTGKLLKKAARLISGAWGVELFSTEATSNENEMSVVQYASLCGQSILLTADAGRIALSDAADYAEVIGIPLPGIDKFQVPHHGSRRNLSSELLDRWLGPKLAMQPRLGDGHFTAICSSAKADTHHPRNAVKRALLHRGANFKATEGSNVRVQRYAPNRADYIALTWDDYPTDYES